jgi:hypothetical protein
MSERDLDEKIRRLRAATSELHAPVELTARLMTRLPSDPETTWVQGFWSLGGRAALAAAVAALIAVGVMGYQQRRLIDVLAQQLPVGEARP